MRKTISAPRPLALPSFHFNHASILFTVLLVFLTLPLKEATPQRPLLNHTSYNSIPTSQHNYKLRNGRTHDIPPIPPSTMASMPPRRALYEEYDSTGLPPLGGRRDSRRRLNLAGLGGSGPRGNNARRGIDSLRKELMKPSVGGPGGGISSGHSISYPAYSATSSIGKIDGIGSLGPAHRYGDPLQPATILAPINSLYPTGIPPDHYLANLQGKEKILLLHHANIPSSLGVFFVPLIDNKYTRITPRLNSISEIRKLNNEAKQHGQADEPADGVDDDIILEEHNDPLQVIKDQIRNSQPQSVRFSP